MRKLDEHGATAVEYCILAALIAAVIIGAVTTLGLSTGEFFQRAVESWQ